MEAPIQPTQSLAAQLPSELLLLIGQRVRERTDRRTAAACALVCRSWTVIGRAALYGGISSDSSSAPESHCSQGAVLTESSKRSSRMTNGFATTPIGLRLGKSLARHPHVARYTESLELARRFQYDPAKFHPETRQRVRSSKDRIQLMRRQRWQMLNSTTLWHSQRTRLLFTNVAPSLRQLKFTDAVFFLILHRCIKEDSISFPALADLHMGHYEEPTEPRPQAQLSPPLPSVAAVLKAMPSLENLFISSMYTNQKAIKMHRVFDQSDDEEGIDFGCDKLATLTFSHVYESFNSRVLYHALTSLEKLVLDDIDPYFDELWSLAGAAKARPDNQLESLKIAFSRQEDVMTLLSPISQQCFPTLLGAFSRLRKYELLFLELAVPAAVELSFISLPPSLEIFTVDVILPSQAVAEKLVDSIITWVANRKHTQAPSLKTLRLGISLGTPDEEYGLIESWDEFDDGCRPVERLRAVCRTHDLNLVMDPYAHSL